MSFGIVALVAAISADVVAARAAASLPALVDGSILLGQEHISEHSSAPRVVFVPTKSTFPAKDQFSRTAAASSERAAMRNTRPIRLDAITFAVHCWGVADPPSPANDYDATQLLYQQVLRSIHMLAPGAYEVEGGEWNTDPKVVRFGRLFSFGVTILTPIPDRTLETAPANVSGSLGVYDGSVTPAELAVTVTPNA